MMDKHTDFFKYIDNFAKIAHVVSVPVKNPEMESPLVTIAIPTYKRADLLKEAIDSALNQDYDETYEVRLNRPFLYMIIDCENNMPVFILMMQH